MSAAQESALGSHSTSSPAAKVKGAGAGAGNGARHHSPKLQSSSRFARMNGISSSTSSSSKLNDSPSIASKAFFPLFPGVASALDESPWTSGYNTPTLGAAVHNVAERAEEALQKLAEHRKGGVLERIARTTLAAAEQIERLVQYEIFSRANAIGGIDNMWLLIDGISSFNPICTATYTFKEPARLDDIRESMARQIGHFPKYTQKLADVGRFFHGTVFINDDDFDMSWHIRSETLPAPRASASSRALPPTSSRATGTTRVRCGAWLCSKLCRPGHRCQGSLRDPRTPHARRRTGFHHEPALCHLARLQAREHDGRWRTAAQRRQAGQGAALGA